MKREDLKAKGYTDEQIDTIARSLSNNRQGKML